MRPFTTVLPFAEARRLVLREASPIARVDRVPIEGADGRVLANDVVALVDVPPFDRAAMDGYAVVAADTRTATAAAPVTLTCTGQAFGGDVAGRIASGECLQIATGAPIPPGADAVVMVEHTERIGGAVRILGPVAAGQHIGRRGADITCGRPVLRAGDLFTPARVGAAAAVGQAEVDVFAKPIVAIVSTGKEIVSPGARLEPGQIFDVNRATIGAVVQRHGGIARSQPQSGDSLAELVAVIDAARAEGTDVLVFSGGSSVGDRDLTIDALRIRGTVIFHGVAARPGKPVVFGRVGPMVVFGMPGYPASCLSTAYTLLLPFLRAAARLPAWVPRTIELPLGRRVTSPIDRHQFYTVRVVDGRAVPAFKTSGDITSLADADGYIEIPEGVETVEAGHLVTVSCFD